MRWVITLLWFLTAFVAGAGLYAATRPSSHALMVQLKGGGLFSQCRQAGSCAKPASSPSRLPSPTDLDRA